MNQILKYKLEGGEPKRFTEYEKYVDRLTVKDVQEAAKLVFNGKNQFVAVLMPENYANKNTGKPAVKAF